MKNKVGTRREFQNFPGGKEERTSEGGRRPKVNRKKVD